MPPHGSPQTRKPIRGSLIFWLRFLGVVAFVILLLTLPRLSKEVALFHISNLRWVGLCVLLVILQLLLEAVIWQRLLAIQRIRQPYGKTFVAYLASQYLGLVTPGHVGEFLAAGYISMNTGLTMGYALSSVVMQKVLMWITMAGFGLWGLPLFMHMPILGDVRWEIVKRSLIVLVALSAGIAVWVLSMRRLARRWQKLSPWQIEMAEFWAGWRQLMGLRLLLPLAVAALSFSLLFLQLYAVLHALGIALPIVTVAQIAALSRIMGRVIPLSFLGFGMKEAIVIELLQQQGFARPVGLAVTLLWLVGSQLLTLLLSGLCWWVKPLVIRRASPSAKRF